MKTMVLLFALLLCGAAQATDLLGAYRDALAYDAQFAAARSALAAGREKLPQGRAGLLPTIGFTANTGWNDLHSRLRTDPASEAGLSYHSDGWSLTLSQPLFRWQNWLTYQEAGLQVAQAEAQFAQAKQSLALRVAQAYFDVLLAQDTLAADRAQKVAIREQLAAAKRNFEVGTATITDTNEAQARYDLIGAQEISARNDLASKRSALATLIGKNPGTLKNLRPGVEIGPPHPDDVNTWLGAARRDSLAVQFSEAGLQIASREVEKQHAGHYPTLDLVASRGRESQSGALVFGSPRPGSLSDSTTIGLQLAIPLYSGGAIASRERQAVDLRDQARSDLDNARRQAVLSARQAYLNVTSGLAQVKALKQGLASSKVSLASNKLGYQVGVRINIDVLNAQQQVYSTERDLAKARLDTLSAQLQLEAAVGALGEKDIAAINALLQ